MNSFSTPLLLHLDKEDLVLHFWKKSSPIRWSIAEMLPKILRDSFILTHPIVSSSIP